MIEPTYSPQQENILQACLVAMQSGASLKDCLAQYPNEATWLKSALLVSSLMVRLPARELPAPNVARLEERLLATFEKQTLPKAKVLRPAPTIWAGWQRAAAMVVTVLAFGFLGGTGTVMASANSQPTDALYSVKRAWESVIVLIAEWIGRLDDVWAHLAQVRYEELLAMRERGTLQPEHLNALNIALENALLLADSETRPQVFMLVSQVQPTLSTLEPLAQSTEYSRLSLLLTVQFTPNGTLEWESLPAEAPSDNTSNVLIDPTATLFMVTLPTETPASTPSSTPTATSTPRFAPTATRIPAITLTNTPTPTLTQIVIATATHTLTPLPLPGLSQTRVIRPTETPSGTNPSIISSATPRPGDSQESPFIRLTFEAVYMTQTAEAQATEETP